MVDEQPEATAGDAAQVERDLAELRGDIRWWATAESRSLPHKREHLDRPEWAYDEDGYCVDCGNGNWKAHNTWCEIAYLIDRAVAAGDPLYAAQALLVELWRLRAAVLAGSAAAQPEAKAVPTDAGAVVQATYNVVELLAELYDLRAIICTCVIAGTPYDVGEVDPGCRVHGERPRATRPALLAENDELRAENKRLRAEDAMRQRYPLRTVQADTDQIRELTAQRDEAEAVVTALVEFYDMPLKRGERRDLWQRARQVRDRARERGEER